MPIENDPPVRWSLILLRQIEYTISFSWSGFMIKIFSALCFITTVTFLYADTVDIFSHVRLSIPEYISSSKLTEKDKPADYYGPEKAFDRNPDTAWCEGRDGDGIGEYIMLETKPVKIYGVAVLNGFGKFKHLYMQNNRVKDFRLTLYPESGREKIIEDSFDRDLCGQEIGNNTVEEFCSFRTENSKDYNQCIADKNNECLISDEIYSFGGQKIVLNKPLTVNKIRLEILSIYRGEKFNDTCISEIRLLNFRYDPKDFDRQTRGYKKY